MTPLFHPKLINGTCGDPALYIEFLYQRRAILFDCGDLHALSHRQLLKISHIFITHTHMDHFIGFDHLLRLLLGREKVLHIFGPAGIIRHLHCKLCGYTWNLVQNYNNHFEINAYEVTPQGIEQARFICQEGFNQLPLPNIAVPQLIGELQGERAGVRGILVDEPSFSIIAAPLTHAIPTLGFAFQEKFHININKDALESMGFTPGPWLNDLKSRVWEERADDEIFTIPGAGGLPLGTLKEKLITVTRGEKIAYVTDTAWNQENAENIIQLANGADYFFCEAAFMQADSDQAMKTNHLTAAQAGYLARQSKVQRLIPFHFSTRYHDAPQMLEQEAQKAFMNYAINFENIFCV